MTLYKNKYRVESIRLKNWDYSNNGFYFVTLCTKKLLPFLGKIINDEWYKSEEMRPNIILDEFVIMPNHIHGIIVINNPTVETYCNTSLHESTQSQLTNNNDNKNDLLNVKINFNHNILPTTNNHLNTNVETYCNTSLRESTPSQSINKKNNLSNIIRGFKSSSTKLIHIMGFNDFAWQPRFYEHIIKDEKALQNIRQYIINNPINWAKDKNNI